jgi:hypothetical protein
MGGFARLKEDFDKYLGRLNPETDPFRFLYLRSLFEIAGNLDTIALCQRALVEQSEKSRLQAAEGIQQFKETFDKINNPPVFSGPPLVGPAGLPHKFTGKKGRSLCGTCGRPFSDPLHKGE